MTTTIRLALRQLPALLAAAAAAQPAFLLPPAVAPASGQTRCYQVASFVAPDQLRCQPQGKDMYGRTIWLCC